jgi:hypothetical protein
MNCRTLLCVDGCNIILNDVQLFPLAMQNSAPVLHPYLLWPLENKNKKPDSTVQNKHNPKLFNTLVKKYSSKTYSYIKP